MLSDLGIHRADPFTDFPIPGIIDIATITVAIPNIHPAYFRIDFASQRLNPTHIPVPTTSQSPCLWRKKRVWPRLSGENAPTLASMVNPRPTSAATQATRICAEFRPMVSSSMLSATSPCLSDRQQIGSMREPLPWQKLHQEPESSFRSSVFSDR